MPDYTTSNVIIGISTFKVDGTSLGYTSGGVNLGHSSDKMEVEVDQSYSAIDVRKVREKYEIKTNLAEATLENLKIIWEQTGTVTSGTGTKTLSWGMNQNIVEHVLEFKGKAPGGYTRTWTILRAVVWESGEVVHQKDGVTLIPVTFRILPVTSLAAGHEYGNIQDATV